MWRGLVMGEASGMSMTPSPLPSSASSDARSDEPLAAPLDAGGPATRPTLPEQGVAAPHSWLIRGGNGRFTPVQLIGAVLLFAVAVTVTGIVALSGSAVLRSDGATPLGPDSPPVPAVELGASILGAAIMLVGHLLLVWALGGRRWLAVRGGRPLRDLGAGLLLGTALVSVAVLIIMALGGYRVQGLTARPELLIPLSVGINAAFLEEILFRGALLRLTAGWVGPIPALIISGGLFGLVHSGNPGVGLPGAILIAVQAGLLLGAAYLLTGTLWFAIGIHLAWNTVQSGVFSYAVSGLGGSPGLLRAESVGPDWLTGGAMGLEGSVVTMLVAFSAGVALLVLAQRRGLLRYHRSIRRDEVARQDGADTTGVLDMRG